MELQFGDTENFMYYGVIIFATVQTVMIEDVIVIPRGNLIDKLHT